jgi:hypothetical protein
VPRQLTDTHTDGVARAVCGVWPVWRGCLGWRVQFKEAFAAWAGDAKPALVVVPVPALPDGFLVQVDAVAAVL